MSRLPWLILLLIALAACTSPSTPLTPTSANTDSISGMWSATISDSTGSLMGSGVGGPSVASAWSIVQNGNTISGTWSGPGMMMRGQVTMTGTFDGHTGTFTMTIPAGAMMGACAAPASGTFEMNEARTELHCQYSGSNTCSGPFQHGEMMLRR